MQNPMLPELSSANAALERLQGYINELQERHEQLQARLYECRVISAFAPHDSVQVDLAWLASELHGIREEAQGLSS